MAKTVLLNARTFAGAVDLTGLSNKTTIDPQIDAVDVTTFGSGGWKEVLAGLAETEVMVGGFWESGAVAAAQTWQDPEVFANLGAVGPWTVAPVGAADQALAWVTSALKASYKLGGTVGDAAPFEASGKGSSRLARGVIAHPPGTPRTASGSGTANQLGALSASQALYVNLHVLSIADAAATLTVRVESDNASGFPSPVTVGTFTAVTAALGGQTMRIAGPITDDWFRVAWTISGGVTPSYLFVVSFGRA